MSEPAADQLLDGKYKIVRLVGQGAWATVYEAVNLRIQRRVAIKVLHAGLAEKPELATRFTREAEAATQIESPFVVTMYDAGTLSDGRPYIVMEFLEGESLGARLERSGPLSAEQAARYAVHLLSGLADAHETGVLHRDIKPDNLVIVNTKHGEVLKLVDFGISKPNVARPEMLAMTRADVVLGSPVYMSPEQARGTRHMDHRSDLYSVGVVLYEALTRELPHAADNFNELMFKVALEDAPDPRSRRPDLDGGMAAIIMKSLARDPAARYQSAAEFRHAVTSWLERCGEAQPAAYTSSNFRVRTRLTSSEAERAVTIPAPTNLAESGVEAKVAVAPSSDASKRKVAIVVGAVLFAGAGGFAFTRSSSPAPAATPGTGTPTATMAPLHMAEPAPILSAVPANTITAVAIEGDSVGVTSATSASSPKTGTAPVRGAGKRPVPTASAAASTVDPTGTPSTSTTVVEGRTIRTTF